MQTTTETSNCRDTDVIGRKLLATSSLQFIDRNAALGRKAISAKIVAVLSIRSIRRKLSKAAIAGRSGVLVSGVGKAIRLKQHPYFTTVCQQKLQAAMDSFRWNVYLHCITLLKQWARPPMSASLCL
jgi:hypothetical protein